MGTKKISHELSRLQNLGPTIIAKLAKVGIKTTDDLTRIGPAQAYLLMQKNEGKKLPVCYYLYSLAGALENKHWDHISTKKKQELLSAIGR
ncbi:TfoX/Sxy family DNA transformation protein [Kamptonema cortianum]|nr:TfoX/Sxy family DNA transformation protein [Oscillatoria laete-virens]MDK3159588.1 TfoX/Sxy family DNA transformation protein [Kamptonema cortianum]MDL5048635.1 TfoX/Sxy family DNA transformation protein [Oscillatoria amoena NRMC-F 0135]MDL5053274.1 TfoX/Sxy family DNA transformation protein [Oscillatoria laete-virens NRMC-F 0139]